LVAAYIGASLLAGVLGMALGFFAGGAAGQL